MGFIPLWLSQLIGDSQFDACVERVINDIEDIVWNRIADLAHDMSENEARGYIRARSSVVINNRLDVEPRVKGHPGYRRRLFQAVQEKITVAMNARIHQSSNVSFIPMQAVRQAA